MALRITPLHRVLHRHTLLFGADRELVLGLGCLCAGLAVSAQNLPAFIVCAVLFFALLAGLRMMGKADPQMRHVYLRYITYQIYYAARSRPHRENALRSATTSEWKK